MPGCADGTTDGTVIELDRRGLVRAGGGTAVAGLAGVGAPAATTLDCLCSLTPAT
jgi:hypothetical protein